MQVGYKPAHAADGEAILHKRFAAHRLNPDPALERTGQGVTEWFGLDCYLDAFQILAGSDYVTAPQKIADMPREDLAAIRGEARAPRGRRRIGRNQQMNIKVTIETRQQLDRLSAIG